MKNLNLQIFFVLSLFFVFFGDSAYSRQVVDNGKLEKLKRISFFDLWSDPKRFNGKIISIHGVIDVSSSEFSSEDKDPSDYGYGVLYFDFSHYQISDTSASVAVYLDCASKINIHKFNGKMIDVIGVYWHVDHSIVNNQMGVIQVETFGGQVAGGTSPENAPEYLQCRDAIQLNGVPNTRPK